jgi:ferredoxin-NADP reductase
VRVTISSTAGLVAGVLFVGLAICNVVLMLEAERTQNLAAKSRLAALHRIGGYAYVVLFCIMAYLMSPRVMGLGLSDKLPKYLLVHIVLSLVLVPLLVLKILIVCRYKHRYSFLMPLGLSIFVISALLVAIPAFSKFLRTARPEIQGFKVTAVVIVALALVFGSLVLRATVKRSNRSAMPLRPASAPEKPTLSALPNNAKEPLTLLLAKIFQETHDTKTLRFLVPRGRRLQIKPGQFLTFQWIIEGRRVVRSYTVSSSPARVGYVEITLKRVESGCVSTFLHEQAKTGLTVEATGPYGQFCFDEILHRSVVLIAAGSGITPMISILRYIDDLCLPTHVTLLYFVRTRKDIIFEKELDRLRGCVPAFDCHVCLSQPDEQWTGDRGRVTQEFILERVADLESATFFLCGPQGFMTSARQILTSAHVNEGRIMEESFGERKTDESPSQSVTRPVATVEFALSKKICGFPTSSSLLDVAENNGVSIPFGCRQGQCGTCATKVLHGAVRMDSDAGLTAGQRSAGYVLPCVSRAEGNVIVQA